MNITQDFRLRLLGGTAIAVAGAIAVPVMAQDAEAQGGLQEIIVTAQKREQSLQDVPVAVTAVTQDSLIANRIVNVIDLSSIAPGVVVRPTIGSASIPTFSVRGALSVGSTPGSDKQVSLYLDGVYLSSPRGSIFDLPNVERIEMLRGPQGTLFGRNATAGAISVSTQDPIGKGHIKAALSYGNYDMVRYEISAHTPELGPLSGYFSFVTNKYRGYAKNGLLQTFDRSTNAIKYKETVRSSEWLGGKDSDTVFASVKLETGDFKAVYKYDRNDVSETPAPMALIGYDFRLGLGAAFGSYVNAIVDGNRANGFPLASDGKRPNTVWNSYNTPSDNFQQGHNLRMEYKVNDQISIKNIAAVRKSAVRVTATLTGADALPIPASATDEYIAFVSAVNPAFAALAPAVQQAAANALVGQSFMFLGSGPQSRNTQWSNELQVNYNSDLLTLTLGGLYFRSKDWVNEHGQQNTVAFTALVNNVLPYLPAFSYNEGKSLAAYAQGELHLTPQLDVVLGGRFTRDRKLAQLTSLTTPTCPATITSSAALKNCPLITSTFNYKDSKFNYLIGVNFRPNDDVLLYAKWSTAYVSGGKVGPLEFDPENAKSAEAGVKADLLNRRLRTNLSVFWADYKDVQSVQGGNTLGALPEFIALVPDARIRNALSTFIYPLGDITAKGLELEVTAAPIDTVLLGGSLSYTDTKIKNVPTFLKAAQSLPATGDYQLIQRPKWTANAYAQYTSEPIWGDATFTARVQGNYQSRQLASANANIQSIFPFYTKSIAAYWLVNARAAFENIEMGGLKGTLAVWGKNVFNDKSISFAFNQSGLAGATFVEPRRYGVDFIVEF